MIRTFRNSALRHNAIVKFILAANRTLLSNPVALHGALDATFGAMSDRELWAAIGDAAGRRRKEAAARFFGSDGLSELRPLLEGMPESMTLGECARIKAAKGDPLAIRFLQSIGAEKRHRLRPFRNDDGAIGAVSKK